MPRRLILVIDLAPGIDPDDVATDLNAAVLIGLEEDAKKITGYEFIYEEKKKV